MGDSLALHLTLAALYFVLNTKGDLSEIGRGHPKINKHKFYQPGAEFPADISHLLPPSERCWWEHLGKSLFTFPVTYQAPRDRQTAKCKKKASAEEWIKSKDSIMETMTRPNGVYTQYVSTSPPESEQDDA